MTTAAPDNLAALAYANLVSEAAGGLVPPRWRLLQIIAAAGMTEPAFEADVLTAQTRAKPGRRLGGLDRAARNIEHRGTGPLLTR